ncbi:MAG TPA: S-layer homology domain-containing protein, partial [Thermoanaerobaculia bacterium]|nr:S-layer homology domain-containing protein [Thermoanaerobaculia bacterium]
HDFVESIVRAGITAGCGGGNYCPDASVTRAQMAVFLLKAEHGPAYAPPACQGVFADTPCPGPFTDWIEQLAAEGITGGCGGGNYCPASAVTRAQMAVFLLKTLLGSSYTPPAAAGIFGDVPIGSFAADWIEDLYGRQITGGCSSSPLLYCPNNANTRGQMAVFLTKTFSLP